MKQKSSTTLPTLTTERLTLRQLLEHYVEEIFLLRSDAAINKYLNRKPCQTAADALNFIKSIRKNEMLYWAVTQTGNEKLIGTICLFDVMPQLNKCEIGYELLTGYQGQGFMAEAVNAITAFAFNIPNVKIIEAVTHKNNLASTKLLEKLKFKQSVIVDVTNPDLIVFRLSN